MRSFWSGVVRHPVRMGNDPSPAYFPFHPKRCRATPESQCSNGSTLSRGGLHLCNILVTPLILLLEVGWQQVYAATDIERHMQSLACRIVFRNGTGIGPRAAPPSIRKR